MAGCIIGLFGPQRSGKTLLAYLLSKQFKGSINCPVYTNMYCDEFHHLDALCDLPFNTDPKILLLDEIYYFLDSRNFGDKNQTEASIFFNTIGKQNILLLMTAISPDTVEMRLRNQMSYIYMVKSTNSFIDYLMIDVYRNKRQTFSLKKCPDLFNKLNYETLQVPDFMDINLKDFKKKVDEYNRKNFKNKNNTVGGILKL